MRLSSEKGRQIQQVPGFAEKAATFEKNEALFEKIEALFEKIEATFEKIEALFEKTVFTFQNEGVQHHIEHPHFEKPVTTLLY